jgi:hypothetical protein
MMKEAYEANQIKGGSETDFCKAKKFYDHIRRIRLPEYYTEKDINSANSTPWTYDVTAGRLFTSKGRVSEQTVVFARFFNSSGDPLVRSPMSTISLLEMSAMAQEVLFTISLLAQVDKDFLAVEGALYSAQLLKVLYNPDITEYSVCVHLVSNLLSLTDPVVAFQVCARLAGIVLNMPTNYFPIIRSHCPIADILKVPKDHQSVTYLREGLIAQDHGTLFYLLCNALPSADYSLSQSISKYVDTAMERIGINIQEMYQETVCEANKLYEQLENSLINEIVVLSKSGYKNFNKLGNTRDKIPFSQIDLPPVLLSDSTSRTIFANTSNQLSGFDIDLAFENLYNDGQKWVERFSEACL